jgi:DnaJ-class molecular chaperone
MKDFYSTLGVSKSASQDEIKSAYRKLAKQHHPDLGGDADKFKSINEAYDVLGDPNKRAEYDRPQPQFNFNNQGNAWDMNGLDMNDFFSIFAGAGFPPGNRRPKANANLRARMNISLESILEPQKKIIQVGDDKREIEVNIPRGVRNGAVISYKGLGQKANPNLPAGDLLIEIAIQEHKEYLRDGDDLHSSITVDAIDAMLGCTVDFRTIRGRTVRVNIPRGVQHGQTLRLHGEGIPNNQGNKTGNQYLQISVLVPNNLTASQLELLAQLKKDR